MKLRINGSSIRLRLSQNDVQLFKEAGSCSETIDFGYSALTYMIKVQRDIGEVRATFINDTISVEVPELLGLEWCNTDMVGFDNQSSVEYSEEDLKILVEKDFECLHRDNDEKEKGLYPNPLASVKS